MLQLLTRTVEMFRLRETVEFFLTAQRRHFVNETEKLAGLCVIQTGRRSADTAKLAGLCVIQTDRRDVSLARNRQVCLDA